MRSPRPLTGDVREVSLRFDYDGGIGKGGEAVLSVDREVVARARIERTARAIFSMNEQLDIGVDRGSPVAEETAGFGRFAFTGTLHHVRIDLPPGGGVRADDRRRVALATH
ncbi:hypothetical protein QM787_20940 [Rhodococcus ruber]|uniref:Uncharacterized protein n=1 Tax=Rhodococcus ruber TaxID=1830 RepID=A0A098BF81_9NOCA|nr:hypothetical protein [Rhodococcus ruber]MCD2128937.1 hypothetical protein [Rhodococcus ruber]MCZ4504821.1 hypothetical protein [Rhodococcus ruber]MCZ4532529.1 hypothetical protein [Rhodococcus ruber]MCZ4623070.1 hypothetical protein [Rhodococcus ruber]MDI9969767.1 hypothetical protein [Rhodococcus ruber]